MAGANHAIAPLKMPSQQAKAIVKEDAFGFCFVGGSGACMTKDSIDEW